MSQLMPASVPGRPRHRLLALTPLALALSLVASSIPGSAAGPVVVTIDPPGPYPAGTSTVTVSGRGFDAQARSDTGIYVLFGPITAAPDYYMDPSTYGAFKWVYLGGVDSQATAPMTVDGTFTTTLDIPSDFTASAGPVDCAAVPCAIITIAAHGAPDRSQDTCAEVQFVTAGTGASTVPQTTPAAVSAAPAPAASAANAAGGPLPSVRPGSACAAIAAAAASPGP